MTVSAQTPINRSTGNGVTTVFPYDFKILAASDILVTVDGVAKTLNVDFTVSGVGNNAGGNVTMTAAPASGASVVRRRDMALVRTTDYQDQGELPAATLDDDIDATVLMIQQVDEQIGRALTLPAGVVGVSAELPEPAAFTLLGWNDDGTAIENYPPLSVGGSDAALVTYDPAGDGAVAMSVQTKLRESVSVKDFGAVGDGVTDDTAAIQAAIAAADNLYWPEGTYLVDTASNAMVPTSKSGMWWYGYGATIKAKDGATAAGNALMLRLFNCSNVVIEGLTFDGNRANRSAFASSSHCIQINDGDDIVLRDVVVKNSTYDGIYVRGTTPGTESTYPTKLLLDNVVVDNAYRNGLSLIGANGVTIIGGRFTNTNGTAPQAGIDIEPNPSDTYSVKNVLIDGTHFEGNAGTGITVTGNVGLPSDNIKLMNITGKSNAECFILAGYAANLIIDGASVNGDTTIPTRTGIISVLSYAEEVNIRDVDFRDITGVTATKAAIWTEVGATIPRYITNVRASNISCQTVLGQCQTNLNGAFIDNDTSTEPAIYFSSHSYSTIKNVTITNKTGASSVALRVASTYTDVANVTLIDVQAGVRMQGTNNKYRDITLLKNGTATLYGAYMDTGTGVVIENVNISDTGGYYTNTTAFNVSAVASLAGARFRDVYPSPMLGSATWDPASIANGASASTTVSVTRADLGDQVRHSHSISCGGLTSTAYVSAANTVTVVLSNTTGGAVDLASHTVNVEVIK